MRLAPFSLTEYSDYNADNNDLTVSLNESQDFFIMKQNVNKSQVTNKESFHAY